MIRSMTGYGRASGSAAGCDITVEIRSVNHRYFDCTVRIPRMYVYMEEPIKTRLNGSIARGKTDVFVTIEKQPGTAPAIQVNRAAAESYFAALSELQNISNGYIFGSRSHVDLVALSKMEGVLTVGSDEPDEDELTTAVLSTLSSAVESYLSMSRAEGERLAADILDRAETIEQAVGRIEERSKECVSTYFDRLLGRLKETLEKLGASADENRIVTEAAIYADKVAVDEETVRLRSHITELRSLLKDGGAVGRKLDFLIQEFNREANTIGSKASDIDIAREVVALKSEIEKIREQVQNIE